MARSASTAVVLFAMLGCSSESEQPATEAPVDLSPLGGDRPVDPIVPDDFDPTVPTPLVIMLHGYGANGAANDIILQLDDKVNERGFIYLRPDGTFDDDGRRFWNATDACCNLGGVQLDDVAYIQDLIDEARARYTIEHVALIGHSNGGFMSHRFACDRASSIDAFASLAGMAWLDPTQCQPDAPVRALQMHGTDDPTVLYEGNGDILGLPMYPGAAESVAQWAVHNDCGATPVADTNRDYTPEIAGAETKVSRYADCAAGGAAELWALEGEGHLPSVNDAWRDGLLDFLLRR